MGILFGTVTTADIQEQHKMTLHEKHIQWIEARGLTHELAISMGLQTKSDASGHWLAIPYRERGKTLNHKYRLTSDKRHRMDANAPLLWWNLDCLQDQLVQDPAFPVVICEGEWDGMTALQAGRPFVLSVPNGADEAETNTELTPETDAKRFQFFWRSKADTDKVARFIIATDGDKPGRNLAHELVRRLGAERCLFVDYPDGCKDLNDVALAHGIEAVAALLSRAKPYPVKGLYKLSDFPDPPEVAPYHVRIPHLYEAWPIVPGTFSVVTGYAGQGKTSLILACMADLIVQGVAVAIGSFETMPRPILENNLRGHICQAFHGYLTHDQLAKADTILAQNLSIIAQHPNSDTDEITLEEVLDLAAVAVLRDGVKVVLLDPWNELEHKRRPDETETDYTGRAIRAMKRFARQYQVALILVAHPRKPIMDRGNFKAPTLYDIAGSANFANKADYGIVIHRRSRDNTITDCFVTKVRMGLPGAMGNYDLNWDWQRSKYERVASAMQDNEA